MDGDSSIEGDLNTRWSNGEAQTGKTAVSFEDRYAKYLRIIQTGERSDNYWSIQELNIIASSDKDVKVLETNDKKDTNYIPYYITTVIGTVIFLWIVIFTNKKRRHN